MSAELNVEQRGEDILNVFNRAFGDLLARDPTAFQGKFRKMAASPFAFYRGSACLFYNDLEHEQHSAPFLDDKTKQIWIHGDLHAENFGTYMNSEGTLIFNVNDFDEAYVGPFTWDLKRFVASIALIGYTKALSDKQITSLVEAYVTGYRGRNSELATLASEEEGEVLPFTLSTAQGPLLEALRSARLQTRIGMLESMTEIRDAERQFTPGKGTIPLDEETREKVAESFNRYLETIPESKLEGGSSYRIKDIVGRRGIGIGSAGLPSYNLLVEGGTEALENDVVIYMKQSAPAAVSAHVDNPTAASFFKHEGHRTVMSQRALQEHADPWLGWTEIDEVGQLVAEVSPYAVDLDWDDINDVEEMANVAADLGRATAMMHGAGDNDNSDFQVVPFSPELAIADALGSDEEGFMEDMVKFAHEYSAQARRDHQIFVDLFRNGRIPGLSTDGDESD